MVAGPGGWLVSDVGVVLAAISAERSVWMAAIPRCTRVLLVWGGGLCVCVCACVRTCACVSASMNMIPEVW